MFVNPNIPISSTGNNAAANSKPKSQFFLTNYNVNLKVEEVHQKDNKLELKLISSGITAKQNQTQNQNPRASLFGGYEVQAPLPSGTVTLSNQFEKSPIYVISGVVAVQIKNHVCGVHQAISIETEKLFAKDLLMYKITCISKALEVDETEFFFKEHDKYHFLIKGINDFVSEFDVTVVLDVFSNSSPFSSIYEDTEDMDFELRGENGSVKVHKTVLLCYGPVFKSMLTGPWKESPAGKVELVKVTAEDIKQLLDYMYIQKIPDTGVEQLAALASYYQISDLKQRCAVKLLQTLSAENTFQLLDFAIKFELQLLRLGILDFIQRGGIKIKDVDRNCADD